MISICLVTYKNHDYTNACIKSLKRASYKDIEILVWDNSYHNLGFPFACNTLAEASKGEYIFFLNNDTWVKDDIFERLLESKSDITGCQRYDYFGYKELDGAFSVDRFGFPAGDTGPLFYPDGAMFMKKSIFEELGGFDEKTFMYGEDRDFCWRAFLHGYSVGVNYGAVFYHDTHSALGKIDYTRRYHSEKNTIRYMLKNYTRGYLWRRLPQYLVLSLAELLFLLCTGKHRLLWQSYFPAYLWNIRNLKDTLRERRKVVHNVPDKYLPFSKEVGKIYALKKGLISWE